MEVIKTVKFHTAVQIGSQPMTYINPADFNARKAEISEVTRSEHGVVIKSASQTVIVGWSNIVYIVLENEQKSEVKTAKKSST